MKQEFSLAHLTVLGCAPPEMTYIAARAGYDYVSIRPIYMGLPGEPNYALAEKRELLRQTKAALNSTGVRLHDIELARIFDGVDVKSYYRRWRLRPNSAAAVLSSIWWRARLHIESSPSCALWPAAVPDGRSRVCAIRQVPTWRCRRCTATINRPNAVYGWICPVHRATTTGDLDACRANGSTLPPLRCPGRDPGRQSWSASCAKRMYAARAASTSRASWPTSACVYSIELPNKARHEEMGYSEHATRCSRR